MIQPMTPMMAVTTARQIYTMLYGLEVDEELFVQMVAPEILGVARMENKAAQETFKSWCVDTEEWCNKGIAMLASRYSAPSSDTTQSVAQPEPQPVEETQVVLATEEELKALL